MPIGQKSEWRNQGAEGGPIQRGVGNQRAQKKKKKTGGTLLTDQKDPRGGTGEKYSLAKATPR